MIPVIGREIRASARQNSTFYLRSLSAAVLLLTSFIFGMSHGFGPTVGAALFGRLHLTLFLAIWVLVPFLAFDCISVERREGTLGLLFMTRLRATDIVVAKGLVHGLRALGLWVAVLPVLAIPFMLGGVSWQMALFSVGVNLSAICWALGAGLLSSAWGKRWLRGLVRAAIVAMLFLIVFGAFIGEIVQSSLLGTAAGGPNLDSVPVVVVGLAFLLDVDKSWLFPAFPASGQLLWILALILLSSFLALVLAIALAGAKASRSWQDQPASARQLWFEAVFLTPVFWLGFFKRWMKRRLERNPVGWLEQRTWNGRLVTWGWFAVVISVYSAVFTEQNFFRNHSELQRFMAWLLAGSMAMSAAGSFRRERETGVLELLLVSPLGEVPIIRGRLWGLWNQFFPAFGTLLGIWLYFASLFHDVPRDTEAIFFYAVTFWTLPVIGLYYSLRCRKFIAAFLATIGVGLVAPVALPSTVGLFNSDAWQVGPSCFAGVVQFTAAVMCWVGLQERLKRRSFPLERGEG